MSFEVNNLHVSYGGIVALAGISLQVNEGEVVCLIGANGAGKSTLLRTISGLVKPKCGSIIFNNEDITAKPPYKIVGMGISQSPEGRKVFTSLSVEENLIMGSYVLKKMDRGVLEFIYDTFPRLKERRKQLAGTLSGGEQQMLAIGRSLMAKPKLLLLDEPSLGLAPLITKELFALIKRINELRKLSILVVEQNAQAALKLAHRAYVLDVGKVVMSGTAHDFLHSEELKDSYMGKSRH